MNKYLDYEGLKYYHSKINPTIKDVEAFKKGDKPLVTPQLTTNTWSVKSNDGTSNIAGTYSGTAITVPTGAKVTYTGKWKWTASASVKSPEGVSGSWDNVLPASGIESAAYTSPVITTTNAENKTAAQVKIIAARKGLMLNGQKIVGASGDDATSASATIYFRDNLYYGAVTTTSPDSTMLNTLTSVLVNSKNSTVPATTTTSQYFCYAYPKSYGVITSIIADGVDQIRANFREPLTVSVTNKAGLAKDYYVYVSVNLGAFNKNSLAFS